MANRQIAYGRLLRQRIAGEGLKTPAETVRWMGAIQAQDYTAGKWAIGLRTARYSDVEVEAALARGEIIRTHVMRPTWHFIAPEDIRWMQALTAPRVNVMNRSQYGQFELDAALFRRSSAALEKALRGGKQLTRAELGTVLAMARIPASGLRLTYIVFRAELDALICSGARRGKQLTYALVDERAPRQRKLDRDESLAVLTERYFTSHGPATLRDYTWWSGLTAADARGGLEMVKSRLISEAIEGQSYWMTASAPESRFARGTVYLLPNYDEYMVGYTDRAAILDEAHAKYLDARQGSLLNNAIVRNGQVIGLWKRTIGRESVSVQSKLFAEPGKAERHGIQMAAKSLAKFLGVQMGDSGF